MVRNNKSDDLNLLIESQQLSPSIPLDEKGNYITHQCAMFGNIECLKSLESYEHKLDTTSSDSNRNALHTAIIYNQHHVTDYLLDKQEIHRPNGLIDKYSRVDVNLQDVNGNTPLHIAAQGNNVYAMECLMAKKELDQSLNNKQGRNFIEEAIHFEAYDFVDQLTFSDSKVQLLKDGLVSLESGFKQQMLTYDKQLPLVDKLSQTGVDIIEFKQSQDQDSHVKINEIIKSCIENYQIKSLESVLNKSKLDFNDQNNFFGNELNPIQLSVTKNNINAFKSIQKHMIKNNMNLDILKCKDENGFSLLHMAAASGDMDLFELIVFTLKTDLHLDNVGSFVKGDLTSTGNNILHVASDFGNTCMVEYILNNGIIDPNEQNDIGLTPLQMASEMGNDSVVRLLIEAGADWEIKGQLGFDSTDIAKIRGNDCVVDLIKGQANSKDQEYFDNTIRL